MKKVLGKKRKEKDMYIYIYKRKLKSNVEQECSIQMQSEL